MITATTKIITPILRETPQASAAQPSRWQKFHRVLTHTHTYSGQSDHGGTTQPPRSYQMLAEWADRLDIEAVGMGSPYTPALVDESRRRPKGFAQEYYKHYSDGSFDPVSLRGDDEIHRMLREANAIANGRTLFYLDNETPKGRYGHLWWVGYQLDLPAWHDHDQPYDHWMCHVVAPGDDCDEPVPYDRRPYSQIVALQRQGGALAFWAHPTSWWWGDQRRFITNIASEMPAHAIADGYLDGMVIMGYCSWRPEYMDVWFMLLDAGYRVTGVAEQDCGLSTEETWSCQRPHTNSIYIDNGEVSDRELVRAFATGRLAATNGPLIDLAVDGIPMGSVARTAAGQSHQVTIWVDPQGASGTLDLVGLGGKVIWEQEVQAPAAVNLRIDGSDQRQYVVARFRSDLSQHNTPAAVSNPVYLHPRGQGFEKPARTRLKLSIGTDSPYHGGRIHFEHANGERVGEASLTAGTIDEMLPASGRFTLIGPDGQAKTEYLINANPELLQLQRYLYRGRFLRDYPDLQPGELPVEAWRLSDFVSTMREIVISR